MSPTLRTLLMACLLVVTLTAGLAPPATGLTPQASGADQLVHAPDVRGHLEALQRVTAASGGDRASGTPAYAAAADYVVDVLRRAGYRPRVQHFDFTFSGLTRPPVLRQDAPGGRTYREGDYLVFDGSASATIDAAVTLLPPACPSGPLPGIPAGNIVLIGQVPGCGLDTLVGAAQQGGAAAVLIYRAAGDAGGGGAAHEHQAEQRFGVPVLGISSPTVAAELRELAGRGLRLHLDVQAVTEVRSTFNILADTPRDRDRRDRDVVVVGAHLDTVLRSPGANDNASSVAAVLGIAERLAAQHPTRNTVRFAFWGAEEPGFLGSAHYVAQLSARERDAIAATLNAEMLGSPNGGRFVGDGDNSLVPPGPGVVAGPPGSGAIEALFFRHFARRGLAAEQVPLLARSDHVPFALAGIPVGVLFGGAETLKTDEQARVFGGTAGVAFDPCYHQDCDRLEHLDQALLLQHARALAAVTAHLAEDLRPVRG